MKKKPRTKAKASGKTKTKARKPVKKTLSKIKSSAKKKALPAKRSKVKTQPKSKPVEVIEGIFLGRITHYFGHVNAAVLKVEKGKIELGDELRFKGHTTDFKSRVDSLQIDRKPVTSVKKGEEAGIEVHERVREGDAVYKL